MSFLKGGSRLRIDLPLTFCSIRELLLPTLFQPKAPNIFLHGGFMAGHASLVSLLLSFVLSGCSLCAAQTPHEVLYAQQNRTLITYDVDLQTLQGTLVGQPVTMPGSPSYLRVFPAPDGRFLYVLSGTQQSQQKRLSVYATDASGAPRMQPVQILGPAKIFDFTIDPNGRFAYSLIYHTNANGNSTYKLWLYAIDSASGKLTKSPTAQATYVLNSYCSAGFHNFNPSGSALVDLVGCGYPSSLSATYYSRTVDFQTGELGPDIQYFSINDAVGANGDEVHFGRNTIIDFHLNLNPFQESLVVFPRKANPKKPIIDCTSAMLAACGEMGGYVPDVSGQYLALSLSSTFEIVKIDLEDKQIVDTGSSFPIQQQPFFSPDDLVMYGETYVQNGNSTIQIYGFNPNTGALTPGGQITVGATLWNIFPARRK
jgi:hypothetical protein